MRRIGRILLLALLPVLFVSLGALAEDRPRARDLGIPLEGIPGLLNAITDVAGVTVGHTTIIEGHGKLVVGEGPVRTGVTAIFPRGAADVDVPVFAGTYALNGNGDAAAATDVMTGEGIGQALLTGRLAAESVIAAGARRPDEAAEFYRAEVHHHLFADHKMSLILNRILSSERGASGAIRVVASSGTWGKRNFARWMFEDEPRAVAATPSRWHRNLLGRPGAYADR